MSPVIEDTQYDPISDESVSANLSTTKEIERYEPRRVSIQEYESLRDASVFVTVTDAGAGHLRPALGLSDALEEGLPILRFSTISSRSHHAGSTNPRLLKGAEGIARHETFQNLVYTPIQRGLLLRQDAESTLTTLSQAIERSVAEGRGEVIFIHTNPDPAFVAGYFKHQLEQQYHVAITNVVVMTDHFHTRSQSIWNLIDVDVIVAPDTQTQSLTEYWLRYWERKMRKNRIKERGTSIPQVVVCGYPQDPTFALPLDRTLEDKRQRELDARDGGAIDVAIPLGGGSPGMPYLATLSRSLSGRGGFDIWTLFKARPGDEATTQYETVMRSIGAELEIVDNNEGLIRRYGARMRSTHVPSIIIVKPGELSNQLIFSPHQVGGAIMLFTEPIGDQEVQNKLFFQSAEGHRVLPTEDENRTLIELMTHLMTQGSPPDAPNHDLDEMRAKATGWRGLALPPDPSQAAEFIIALKRYGILSAMASFHRPHEQTTNIAMSDTGSTDFFSVVNAAYMTHRKVLSQRDKTQALRDGNERKQTPRSGGGMASTIHGLTAMHPLMQ